MAKDNMSERKQNVICRRAGVRALLLLIPVTLCFVGAKWNCGIAQTKSARKVGDSSSSLPPKAAGLRLITTVSSKSYCDTGSVRLDLRLRYDNLSQSPIILFRDSAVIFGHMIARNLKAALAKQYETNKLSYAVVYGKQLIESPSPSDLFVVIKPGGSHETNAVLYLVTQRVHNNGPSEVTGGLRYLQVKVKTWVDSPDFALRLRSRWKNLGELWSEPVTSEPMQLFIDSSQPVAKCL